MSSDGNRIINYEASGAWRRRSAHRYFWVGAICGEAVSAVLFVIVASTGTVFSLTAAYPHLFLLAEARKLCPIAAPAWLEVAVAMLSWLVLGPVLFGVYGLLLSLRRWWLWATFVGIMHLLLFLWVCYLRDAFRYL